jgi:subtilisin-like proprotein convertase family protein
VVGDLDLTGLQLTGNVAGAADDISILLTAPSGLTVTIFNQDQNVFGEGASTGPLTLNDDTRISACDPDCEDPLQSLFAPYAGTANLFGLGGSDTGPLSAFDGTSMKGAWTLSAYDLFDVGETSTLTSWGLRITPAKPVTGAAKPKKAGASAKKTGAFTGSASPNASVPDDVPDPAPSTPITSTITVGKKFKGKVVGDLNVTGIQATGSAIDAPDDLEAKLTAPNGTTIRLFAAGALGDDVMTLGPLTIDDDTQTSICDATTPPCENPLQSLNAPHAGTANTALLSAAGTGPLSSFNGGPMKGTWTLTVWDEVADPGQTSVFNSWGLKITPAQPVVASGGSKKAGAAAKKKKKAKSSFAATVTPNAAVPDEVAVGPSPEITSTIAVGKQFKGKTVGDLNVTGIRTTGVGVAADDLTFTLVGPGGRTVQLIEDGALNGQSIGGLTLDDDVRTSVCDDTTPPCFDPIETLNSPFAGTVNMRELETVGTSPLSTFDGTPMKGTWTLHVVDEQETGATSTLNAWGLKITAAKPVK